MMLAELVVHDETVWIKGYEVEVRGFALRPCDCHQHPDYLVWVGPRPPTQYDTQRETP